MLDIKEIRTILDGKNNRSLYGRFEGWETTRAGEKYRHKFEVANTFLQQIVQEDFVALRLGKLRFQDLKSGTNYPIFVQKEVDMLFGLDISHIAYMKLADKVMLFSRDTDIVPAMKTARINGLEVILPLFDEDGFVSEKLIKHSDTVRRRSLVQMFIQRILKSV